jgi:hypothetical protein
MALSLLIAFLGGGAFSKENLAAALNTSPF